MSREGKNLKHVPLVFVVCLLRLLCVTVNGISDKWRHIDVQGVGERLNMFYLVWRFYRIHVGFFWQQNLRVAEVA